MHHENIEALREDALHLIGVEQRILKEMLDQNVLSEPEVGSEQTFDTTSAPKTIEILGGESFKLQELDMVLAVVGTMKAGKSTTINAIVGTEILPNRNAPMTAIPTLIRHTKGQVEPKLVFKNYAPLEALMEQLGLQLKKPEYQDEIEKLRQDKDLYELVIKIQNQEKIGTETLGQKAIFDFLKGVNDLVRISPLLGQEFPFGEYADVDKLPVIEIEFTHLKEMGETKGRLILLDTPGPNEAGQSRLRPMLQDQLRKASAVLAVMDYSQLKSEADAQVRADLTAIAATSKGRIYALVNKFDQKDRNGMDEAEVKVFVENLTSGVIKSDQIYPVSSKRAYLANRARNVITQAGSLPSIDEQPWVEDFFSEAGIRPRYQSDAEHIQEALVDLWDNSKFSTPLENVIKVAYDKAAMMALSSAADKIGNVSVSIHNLLDLRERAFKVSVNDLRTLIEGLKSDIENVDNCEEKAKKTLDYHLHQLQEKLDNVTSIVSGNVDSNINEAFSKEKSTTEEKRRKIEEKLKKHSGIAGQFGTFLREEFTKERHIHSPSSKKKKSAVNLADQYDLNSLINFGDRESEAEEFKNNISNIIQFEIHAANEQLEEILGKMLVSFEADFQKDIIVDAQNTLNKLKNKMTQSGFDGLIFELPKTKSLNLGISAMDIMSDVIHQKQHTRTAYRDVDSTLGSLKRMAGGLFGKSSWGRESYKYEVTEFEIDMEEVRKEIKKYLSEYFETMSSAISTNIKTPLEKSSSEFFDHFKKTVENIRGDFIRSMGDRQKKQSEQDEILEKIRIIKKPVPELLSLSRNLKSHIETSSPV